MKPVLPHGLYAITDPALTPGPRLLGACEAALRGGAVMLQYRDKGATASQRETRAAALAELCRQYGALLIINDDPRLARQVGAAGVHLGQSDTAPVQAREMLGDEVIIGQSCHGEPALAQRAVVAGVDYVALGRFFPSSTKPHAPPASLQTLRTLAHELPVPVVAIGGVNPDNARQLIQAGARQVAVINALFGAADIETRARCFQGLFPNPSPGGAQS